MCVCLCIHLHIYICILLQKHIYGCFSPVQLFATLWSMACKALLSMIFSKQESWSGLPYPPPGVLPDPGIEPMPLTSPALPSRFSHHWCFLSPVFLTSQQSRVPGPISRTPSVYSVCSYSLVDLILSYSFKHLSVQMMLNFASQPKPVPEALHAY